MSHNPFAALGLPERPDLDDETVRAAWRAIAAATHPDRADGGDLARYTQASAAYAELRTPWGRGEAYADLARPSRPGGTAASTQAMTTSRTPRRWPPSPAKPCSSRSRPGSC